MSKTLKRENYLSWDEFFMGVSKIADGRIKDPSTIVGACIVGADNRILSIGYNGAPNGFDDDRFPWDRKADNENDTKYPYVCHAEANAILNYPGERLGLRNSRIYVDLFPCNECAKLIVQAGIKEVVYLSDKYANEPKWIASKRIFDECNVVYRKLDDSNQKEILVSLKPDKAISYVNEKK